MNKTKNPWAQKDGEYTTDMSGLFNLLLKMDLPGIDIEIKRHPAQKEIDETDKPVSEILRSIVSEYQVLFKKGSQTISCIRGGVSFGYYELYPIKNLDDEHDNDDIERFDDAEEVVKKIKEVLN